MTDPLDDLPAEAPLPADVEDELRAGWRSLNAADLPEVRPQR